MVKGRDPHPQSHTASQPLPFSSSSLKKSPQADSDNISLSLWLGSHHTLSEPAGLQTSHPDPEVLAEAPVAGSQRGQESLSPQPSSSRSPFLKPIAAGDTVKQGLNTLHMYSPKASSGPSHPRELQSLGLAPSHPNPSPLRICGCHHPYVLKGLSRAEPDSMPAFTPHSAATSHLLIACSWTSCEGSVPSFFLLRGSPSHIVASCPPQREQL